jgi:hypothetical protein
MPTRLCSVHGRFRTNSLKAGAGAKQPRRLRNRYAKTRHNAHTERHHYLVGCRAGTALRVRGGGLNGYSVRLR